MIRLGRDLFLAASIATLTASVALAADKPPMEGVPVPMAPTTASSGWIFQVTPYAWAAGMKGDVSPFRRAPTIHVEKSFSDILDDLNIAGFVNFWARNDRFVLSGDVMYVNIIESATTGPLPIIGAIGGGYDTAQFAATLQAGYRLYDRPQVTFDLMGGARYWHLWNDLNVHAVGRTVRVESRFGWLDPVLGARAHYHINDKFSVLAQGDFGGFGVGSDFTWQALATMNYSFNDKFTLSAGYKILSVDYDRGGRVFDTTLSGPVLGVTFQF